MRAIFFNQNTRSFFLIPLIFAGCILNIQAQITLSINNPGTNTVYFEMDGLEDEDLVYLRFSDGYYVKKAVTEEDGVLNTTFERQFIHQGEYRVAAYVAKKGGTLDLAVGESGFEIENPCPNCTLPSGMSEDQSYVTVSTSWNPFFTEGVPEIPSLQDNITGVTSSSELPWFFVNLTVRNNGASMNGNYLQFSFPDHVYRAVGAIINDEWIEFNGNESYESVSSLISTVSYNTAAFADDYIKFDIDNLEEQQSNFYLVFEGEPESEFDQYEFTGRLYGLNRKKGNTYKLLDEDLLKITPTHQPHDPNEIYSPYDDPCDEEGYIPYIVNFQNLGEGAAIDVDVRVFLNSAYINSSSLIDVETSHPAAFDGDPVIQENGIMFKFDEINLPGLNQTDPVATFNDTKGWVKFKLHPHCPNSFPHAEFETTGMVVFHGTGSFIQNTPLNLLEQKTCFEPCPVGGLNSEIDAEFDATRMTDADLIGELPFAAKVYPTITSDYLRVETTLLQPEVSLEFNFIDVSGKVWTSKNILPNGEIYYQEELDISHLPRGIYFLQIRHGDQLIHKKIVKN